MPPAISTRELTRRFDALTAVDALTLDVQAGEVFGLLGPNGAGKTTTIKMLITLLPPTSGEATVAGHDIRREPRLVRRSIGYVPQLLSSDGALSARENLMTSARLYHLPAAEQHARMDEALEFMGLESSADRLVRTFSGGWSVASRSLRRCFTAPRCSFSTSRRWDWTRPRGKPYGSTSEDSARPRGPPSC